MTDCLTVIAVAMQVEASANPCTDRYSRNGHTQQGIDQVQSNNQIFGEPNGCANCNALAWKEHTHRAQFQMALSNC